MKRYGWLVLLLVLCASCRVEQPQRVMLKKAYIHPVNGFSQVVAVSDGRTKTLYISGQIGEGADLAAQIRSAFANLKAELNACGADYDDLVKVNTYIVDYQESYLPVFRAIRKELFGNENLPASTLVGVQALGRKEWLVEIEAVAVLPATE